MIKVGKLIVKATKHFSDRFEERGFSEKDFHRIVRLISTHEEYLLSLPATPPENKRGERIVEDIINHPMTLGFRKAPNGVILLCTIWRAGECR